MRSRETTSGISRHFGTAGERAAVGGALLYPERYADILERLRDTDFTDHMLAQCWRYILETLRKHHLPSLELLHARFEEDGVATTAYMDLLSVCADQAPFSREQYEAIIEVVLVASQRRALALVCRDIHEKALDHANDSAEIFGTAEQRVADALENRHGNKITNTRSHIRGFVDDIVESAKSKGESRYGMRTGLRDLDEITMGLHSGNYVIVGARPSMGKTSNALRIACNVALRNEKNPVLFFSLEMKVKDLLERVVAAEAKIQQRKMREGLVDRYELQKIQQTLKEIDSAPIDWCDPPEINVDILRSEARRWARPHKAAGRKMLIVVDYLQLVRPPKRLMSREQEVSEISRSLKALGRETEACVMALSQMNRTSQLRASHRPVLSDLRESGSLEQDADLVLLLHRDDYYEEDPEKKAKLEGQADIIVAKNRNGDTGTVKVYFDRKTQNWGSLER